MSRTPTGLRAEVDRSGRVEGLQAYSKNGLSRHHSRSTPRLRHAMTGRPRTHGRGTRRAPGRRVSALRERALRPEAHHDSRRRVLQAIVEPPDPRKAAHTQHSMRRDETSPVSFERARRTEARRRVIPVVIKSNGATSASGPVGAGARSCDRCRRPACSHP